MTREKMVKKLMDMANELVNSCSDDKYDELISMACDWNSKHYGSKDEIFVCDIYEEDGYESDGIMVEDDCFLYR